MLDTSDAIFAGGALVLTGSLLALLAIPSAHDAKRTAIINNVALLLVGAGTSIAFVVQLDEYLADDSRPGIYSVLGAAFLGAFTISGAIYLYFPRVRAWRKEKLAKRASDAQAKTDEGDGEADRSSDKNTQRQEAQQEQDG